MCIKMFTKRQPSESFTKRLLDIDYTELNKLIGDPASFVKLVKCNHHLSLHPYHLANVKKSIDEKLSEEFCRYNKKLDGIILGSQNVRVLESAAPINADMCFVHVDVEVEFFVFTPAVDQVHRAVVSKQGKEQLSCLVHKIFNVFVPKPNDGEDEWLGADAQLGQEIEFRITYIALDGRLPYIKGELLSIISDDSGVSTGEEQSETPKKNNTAKMKKRKLSESMEESFDTTPAKKKKNPNAVKTKKSAKKAKCDDGEIVETIVKKIKKEKQTPPNVKTERCSEEPFTESQVIVKQEVESAEEQPKKKKKAKKIKQEPETDDGFTDMVNKIHGMIGDKRPKKTNSSFDNSGDLHLESLFDELRDTNVPNSDLGEKKKKGVKRKVENRESEDDSVQPVKKVKRKSKN